MKTLLTLIITVGFIFHCFGQAEGSFGIYHYNAAETRFIPNSYNYNGKSLMYTKSVKKTGFIVKSKIPIISFAISENDDQKIIFGDWLGFDAGLPAILGANGGFSLAYVNHDKQYIICPRISFSALLSYTDKFDETWDLDLFSIKYGVYLRYKSYGLIYDYRGNTKAVHFSEGNVHSFDFRYLFGKKDMLRNAFIGVNFMPMKYKYPESQNYESDEKINATTLMLTIGAYGLDFGSR